jgi:hypothetical protein
MQHRQKHSGSEIVWWIETRINTFKKRSRNSSMMKKGEETGCLAIRRGTLKRPPAFIETKGKVTSRQVGGRGMMGKQLQIPIGTIYNDVATTSPVCLVPGHNTVKGKCMCGKEKIFEINKLRTGHTKSCGCRRSTHPDLSGQTFGDYQVIREDGRNKRGKVMFLCSCKLCRAEKRIRSSGLLEGTRQRCTCSRTKNLLNSRFGRYIVIRDYGKNKNGHQLWLCRCDCGVEKVAEAANLLFGNTQSCGCLALEVRSHPFGQAAFSQLFTTYKANARNRHLEFTLSEEQFRVLTKEDCTYCGIRPEQEVKAINGSYFYNGVDRIDNLKGYTPSNSVSCCRRCNVAKAKMTMDEFNDLRERVSAHALIAQFNYEPKECDIPDGWFQNKRLSGRGSKLSQPGEAAFNGYFAVVRSAARIRGKTFTLTKQQAVVLARGDCHYCGRNPSQIVKTAKGNGLFIRNGIDRWDNTIGYEPGNCVPCCKWCNYSKNDMSLLEFLAWRDRVIFYPNTTF